MSTIYVGSLLNKDRRESYHRDEPPLILGDKNLTSDIHFTFIDIIPQGNSNLSFLNTNRTSVTYHNFSDLIKQANSWFSYHKNWEIVNCETVLLFFKQTNDGIWHLAAKNSCFTLDMGAHSTLMALRLWIRRSSLKTNQLDNNGSHKMNSNCKAQLKRSSSNASQHLKNQSHYQSINSNLNHKTNQMNIQTTNHHQNALNCSNDQHINQQTMNPQFMYDQTSNQDVKYQIHLNQRRRSRKENNADANNNNCLEVKNTLPIDFELNVQDQLFELKFQDFLPDCIEPGNHSKFEKLDKVVEKLNLSILNGELLAENVITVESLYFPCDCDWIIENKLDLTLHSFPSNYVCILRVFYIEYRNQMNSEKNESLTCKLRKFDHAFRIQLKDFIPRTLSKGTFFKRPEFEKLSTCIQRASNWIELESKLHQIRFKNLIKQMNNDKLDDHFLFDFKNAQCIEVKTKILRNRIDSKIMAHTSNSGDYIRIFRVAFMEVVSLKNEFDDKILISSKPTSEKKRKSNLYKLKKSNLLTKSKLLIKSNKQYSNASSLEKDEFDESFDDSLTEEDASAIHLSSLIFTPTNSLTTIEEMKRKIQTWSLVHCRNEQIENDELAKYSRKPRLLSAETVEVFTKSFSAEEIEKETDNCFNFNRIGTMNNFLYFSFRIYLDYLDGSGRIGSGLNDDHNSVIQTNQIKLTNQKSEFKIKEDKCVIT